MERMRIWTSPKGWQNRHTLVFHGLFLPPSQGEWIEHRNHNNAQREYLSHFGQTTSLRWFSSSLNLSCHNPATASHPTPEQQSLKPGYCVENETHGNAWILHIHHFVLLEITDSVLQAKLWKYQIFKSRQIGVPLVGSVTQIHYESFGSHTAVTVSVMRAQASQATALFLEVFISCHFFNHQRINRIALCVPARMCGAGTWESTMSAMGSDLWALPWGKNQWLELIKSADDTAFICL